jgi:hypothetical protein
MNARFKLAVFSVYAAELLASAQTNVSTNAVAQTNAVPPPNPLPVQSDLLDQIVSALNVLYGLPSHILVGLSCIGLGYTLRFFKRFPNDGIPLACVFWGMLFNPMMAERTPGSPLRIWLVRHILIGLIIGLTAWVLHKKVLKKIEANIPVLGEMLADADKRSTTHQVGKAIEKVDEAAELKLHTDQAMKLAQLLNTATVTTSGTH